MNHAVQTVNNRKPPRRSWRTAIQRFIHARTSLEAQLFPPLQRKVVFRAYEPADFEACLTIYRKNEPGRFPPGYEYKFIEFIEKKSKAFIVAECDSRVAGYGGMHLHAPNVATLCYGIVDPEFQGQRIGTALILLRITQAANAPEGAFFFIFAVDASIPIYRRFGFIEQTSRWKTDDGKDHPVGLLHVFPGALDRVKSAVKQRGLSIQGDLELHPTKDVSCEIRYEGGVYQVELRPRANQAESVG